MNISKIGNFDFEIEEKRRALEKNLRIYNKKVDEEEPSLEDKVYSDILETIQDYLGEKQTIADIKGIFEKAKRVSRRKGRNKKVSIDEIREAASFKIPKKPPPEDNDGSGGKKISS